MSSPIHCPSCDSLVTETGWGDEPGEYGCGCGTSFRVVDDDRPGLAFEVIDEAW